MKSFNRMFIIWIIIVIMIFGGLITFGFFYKSKIKKYQKFEDVIVSKTEEYTKKENIYPEKNQSIKINIKDLVSANVLKRKDVLKTCDGYVTVSRNQHIKYKPYLKCKYYVTKNK